MLKYKINTNDLVKPYVEMKPISFQLEDMGYEDFYICKIKHDGYTDFHSGEKITISHTTYNDNAKVRKTVYSNKLFDYNIRTVSSVDKEFTIQVNKKYALYAESIALVFDRPNPSFKIKFTTQHYFKYGSKCPISFTFKGVDGLVENFELICEFEDNYTLLWHYDEKNKDFANFIVDNGFYTKIEGNKDTEGVVSVSKLPDSVYYTSPSYIMINTGEEKYTIYEKNYGLCNIPKEGFYRENFLFGEEDEIIIMVPQSSAQVCFGLGQEFSVDTYKDYLLSETFIKDESSAFENNGQDIEKNIYYPVIMDNDGIAHEVNKIKFNIHFRKHDFSNNWKVIEDGMWNGTNDSNQFQPLISNCYRGYNIGGYISNRSDLLSKIGFNDADVKYQKNRLKKTFLRLSYYDSTNPITQRLIAYYNVFFDTGKLLSKYISHSYDKNYYIPCDDNSFYVPSMTLSKLDIGISTNKEPYIIENAQDPLHPTDDEIEDLRLSCQFVVEDRYSSNRNSDGFYVYMYKSFSSPIPENIYMKIEFNHAGYGRKIPLFMPSYILERDSVRGIKKYEDILLDWTAPSEGYSMGQYNAFSYIHLKHCYNYDMKKHVFYLDPEYYGEDALFKGTDIININLYEPKVNI